MSDPLAALSGGLQTSESIPLFLAQEFIFTTRYDVAVLCHPKIHFQEDPTLDPQSGETPVYLLDLKITDAEAHVSQKLGARYVLPLAADRAAFLALPAMTQSLLRECVDVHAASSLLTISHGNNSPNDGEDFHGSMVEAAEACVEMLLEMDQQPLPGLIPVDLSADNGRPGGSVMLNAGYDNGTGTGAVHPACDVVNRLPLYPSRFRRPW